MAADRPAETRRDDRAPPLTETPGSAVAPGRWWADPPTRVLLVLVAAAFLVRLAWVVVATRDPRGLHDPWSYLDLARNIAGGNGYVRPSGEATAYYPVGYPGLLGIAWWLADRSPLPWGIPATAATLNLVWGTASVALLGLLGRRLAGRWEAVAGAALAALFPNLVIHTSLILTETVFNFLLVAALCVMCWRPWGAREPSPGRLAVAGALFGAATLVRPQAVIVVAVVVLVLWGAAPGWPRSVVRMAVLAGVVALAAGPWVVRNAVVMGRPTLATNIGDNLCIGSHPGAPGHFALPDYCFGDQPGGGRGGDIEAARDRETIRRALAYVVSHPRDQARLLVRRLRYTFEHDHDGVQAAESYGEDPWLGDGRRRILNAASDVWYWAVLALSVVSLPRLASRREPRRLAVLGAVAGLTLAPLLFFGDARFHVPIMVLLCLPAGMTLVTLARRVRPT